MNHRASIHAAIEAAKEQIENVVEPIHWMSEAQPEKINAIFLAAAVNDDEGKGVTFEGAALGDTPSLVAAFVNALDNHPILASIMITALQEYQNSPCNCPNCTAERALKDHFNNSKN